MSTNATYRFPVSVVGILAVTAAALCFSGCTLTPESRVAKHMAAGKKALQAKAFRRAIIEFKVAAQNTSTDPEPLYQLGLACLDYKDGRCAFETFEKILRQQENHEGALVQMARLESAANQPEVLASAVELLGRLLKTHPANKSARYILAGVEIKLGRTEDALRTFGAALEVSTDSIDDIRLPIRTAVDKKDLDLARTIVNRALAKVPNSAEVIVTSAEVATLAGQNDLAAAETTRALSLNPKLRPALELSMRQELAAQQPELAESTARHIAALPDKDSRTTHADFLISRGRRDDGLREYAELRARFPQDTAIQSRHISVLIRSKRGTEARAELDKLISANAKRADLLTLRAGLSLDEGRLDDAARDITALGELRVRTPELALVRARYAEFRGDKKGEGEALTEALTLNPGLTPARLRLARLLTEIGKPAEALATLQAGNARELATPQFQLARGLTLMATGDWATARKVVDSSLVANRSVEVLTEDAALRMHAGDLAGAEKTIQEALAKDPGARSPLAQMAAIWQAKKQAPAYLAWLERHADKNPTVASLQIFAGELLRDAGNLPVARRCLERAAKDGDAHAVTLDMARLEIREGKLDAARTRLETALKARESAASRSLLADVMMRQQNPAGAEQNLLEAVRQAPTNSGDLLSLASVISKNPKRLDLAVLYAEKALAAAPGNPIVESSAGWLYYQSKRYPNAVAHLNAALKAADIPAIHYRLAAACMKAGDKECATTQYAIALKQNPKDPIRADAAPLLEGNNR